MSLEQKNKPELVKELRETIQRNKELESRIKELEEDAVNGNVESDKVLPYLGVSLLRGGGKFYIVKLAYDLDGNAKVLSRVEKSKDYNAYYEAERILNTEIDRQEIINGVVLNEDN